MRKQTRGYLWYFAILISFSLLVAPTTAQNAITIGLTRNIGIGLGGLIQGTFTLTASGSEDIQNLTVYFNGEEVYFSEGYSLSWQFNTGDYPSGTTNITVIGLDDLGIEYTGTYTVTFLGPLETNLIIFGIFGLIVIILVVRYGSRLTKKQKAR